MIRERTPKGRQSLHIDGDERWPEHVIRQQVVVAFQPYRMKRRGAAQSGVNRRESPEEDVIDRVLENNVLQILPRSALPSAPRKRGA